METKAATLNGTAPLVRTEATPAVTPTRAVATQRRGKWPYGDGIRRTNQSAAEVAAAGRVAAALPEAAKMLAAADPTLPRDWTFDHAVRQIALGLAGDAPKGLQPDALFRRTGWELERITPTVAWQLVREIIAKRAAAGTLPAGSVFEPSAGDIKLPPRSTAQDYGEPVLYMVELVQKYGDEPVRRAVARLEFTDRNLYSEMTSALAGARSPGGMRKLSEAERTAIDPAPLARTPVARSPSSSSWMAIYKSEDAQRAIAAWTEGPVNAAYGRTARPTREQDGYVTVSFHGWNSCD